MLGKSARQTINSNQSTSGLNGLIDAARSVVTAHALRDDDKASDENVSDAIANLQRCLPKQRRETHADHSPD